ncbi:SNF2_N domain-containing protein [Trichoderma simmonsii]|uniref:SNF2_N domain-containing protein n=1 Tax=Trichoderma simmonsii TaxID=1491479 RepID=A0A8G0LJ22_9HYPO|nr:SNF2_N domain-containing protein [Trichoderma simmonsii]
MKMLDQYADILITGRIDAVITGKARRICAFEIIRQQLGASWDQLDESELHQEGYFYSALTKSFLESPEKTALVNPGDVSEIV